MSIEKAAAWGSVVCAFCGPPALFFAAAIFFGWTPQTFRGLGIVSPPVGLAVIILVLVVIPWALMASIFAGHAVPAESAPLDAIKNATTQTAPVGDQRPALIEAWQLKRLREFLRDKPKGSIRVVGEDGNPSAYRDSQRLAHAFEQSDWTVTKGSVRFGFSTESVFILDHKWEVSKYSSLVGEALAASGIEFQRYNNVSTPEFLICTVYVTAQRPTSPASATHRPDAS
jgi:hypothetical protein